MRWVPVKGADREPDQVSPRYDIRIQSAFFFRLTSTLEESNSNKFKEEKKRTKRAKRARVPKGSNPDQTNGQ